MVDTEGWLARAARRFGEIMRGAREDVVDRDGIEVFSETPEPPTAVGGPPVDLPPGVRLDDNGRYVVGNHSFSTVEQAVARAALLARPPVQPQAAGLDQGRPAPPCPPARTAEEREVPCWVRKPTPLRVGPHTITAELVYFGTPLRHEPRHDQSRIDPRLPVDTRGDPAGTTLTYWPSYAGMDPRARWTYLDWLARGRTDTSVPIGYVFVFFYGLEQRLLVDDFRDDAEAVFAEARRLLAIYGENYSFKSYASRLLALACLYETQDDEPPTLACAQTYDMEIPLDLRVRLGRRLRDGQAIDGDDSLHWVLALPDVFLRTPGQRCFEELRSLWLARFADRHPDGLGVRRPKKVLHHVYRAASGTFTCNVSVEELPDISETTAPLANLRALLDLCMEDLSAYSRLLGRDPEARGRLRGDLLLPAELCSGRQSLAVCRTALEGMSRAEGARGVPASVLARALDVEFDAGSEKLSSTIVRQMMTALDALDFGCEPDRRYGAAPALRVESRVSLFASPEGAPVDHERAPYVAARGMVEVAMLAAMSDGEVVVAEVDAIGRRLRAAPDLSEPEVARLLAYGRALAADPPKVRAALKKIADVAPAQRAALAASAVEAVLADGCVHPDEVRFLEALHAALDLPVASLYSAIHRGAKEVGPVTVLEGVADGIVPIPAEAGIGKVVAIDAARLEQIRDETSKVSALLASIFVEEETEPAVAAAAPRAALSSGFDGLDGLHSDLLRSLLSGPMSRNDFEAVAADLRLMPDGAIEALNEWGFDRIGEAIVEDEEEIRIVPEVIRQIERMGVAA